MNKKAVLLDVKLDLVPEYQATFKIELMIPPGEGLFWVGYQKGFSLLSLKL